MKFWSLRRSLVIGINLAVIAVLVFTAWASYRDILHELDEVFDANSHKPQSRWQHFIHTLRKLSLYLKGSQYQTTMIPVKMSPLMREALAAISTNLKSAITYTTLKVNCWP